MAYPDCARKTEGKILNIKYHGKTTRYIGSFSMYKTQDGFQGREKNAIEPGRVSEITPPTTVHQALVCISLLRLISSPIMGVNTERFTFLFASRRRITGSS